MVRCTPNCGVTGLIQEHTLDMAVHIPLHSNSSGPLSPTQIHEPKGSSVSGVLFWRRPRDVGTLTPMGLGSMRQQVLSTPKLDTFTDHNQVTNHVRQ
jgi:hypothetical protein